MKIMIVGGTGTFGKCIVEHLISNSEIEKIGILSRDEFKQHELKVKFDKFNDKLIFFIGDIRNRERLVEAFKGFDIVVHAAALKQISTCEQNPFEAVDTNILGTKNIVIAAIANNVNKVLAISTDKAVEPINLYGNTKAIMEKLILTANNESKTKFSIARYGNVINSRGSVIPLWKNQAKQKIKLSLTDKKMTRFFISIDEAINFVLFALKMMRGFEIFIPRMPSIKMYDLCKLMAGSDDNINVVGIREGEKLHETLISKTESKKMFYCDDKYILVPAVKCFDVCNYLGFSELTKCSYNSNDNFSWVDTKSMEELIAND